MKRLFAGLIILTLSLVSVPAMAGVDDFYFSDFTVDYYLSKDEDGVSHLKVVENFTTEFPTYRQNKGICRQIPYTNQNDKNIVLHNLDRSNISVLRNGEVEPIYSIEKYAGHYEVCTGTEEYVLGQQVYTFEYEFERVVTDSSTYQELYWDTNGNGWSQRFSKLVARVHFDDELADAMTDEKWCYVGKYGKNDQTRCTIDKTEDGFIFSASDLAAEENLTFVTRIEPGSFTIPDPEKNYLLVWVMGIIGVISVLAVFFPLRKYISSRGKIKYYKGLFVKPEYQPNKLYSIAMMSQIYIGRKKDSRVAILLDMVVNKKVAMIKKADGKVSERWYIVVKNKNALRKEELILLKILNGGSEPIHGDEIPIRVQKATSSLASLSEEFDSSVLSDLRKNKLVELGYTINDKTNKSNIMGNAILAGFGIFYFGIIIIAILGDLIEESIFGKVLVGEEYFWSVVIATIAIAIIIRIILKVKTNKYANHTFSGLDASKYMEGLQLYIRMAEADRLKLLQSVEGVDVTPEGIVKLYEKLLPYAAVFGLEESWMKEMKKYCELEEIEEPDYLVNNITIHDFAGSMHSAASIARSSTHYVSSSVSGGGSFSSSSSGGGGGGFSGGGGGGGGGGGR